MRKSLVFLASALLCISCGPSHVAPVYESEQINMGYGTIDADHNTYAVSKVKTGKRTITYDNMFDYLRGTVPGLTVSSNNFITIRGIGSNNPQQPLFLVDGVQTDDISNIDPNMVSSVEVLKDASASIYGVQGGSGVILITMKK